MLCLCMDKLTEEQLIDHTEALFHYLPMNKAPEIPASETPLNVAFGDEGDNGLKISKDPELISHFENTVTDLPLLEIIHTAYKEQVEN